MRLAPGFWQGAAAASSLLLAGSYVAYSAGILRLSTSESPAGEVTNVASPESPAMFSSSKSMRLVDPESTPTQAPQIFMPPSHYGEGTPSTTFLPPPLVSPPTESSETTMRPSIMVGSKSPAIGPLISPPRQEANTGKAMPELIPQRPLK